MPVVVQTIVVDESLLDLSHRRARGLLSRNGRSDDEKRVHVDVMLAMVSR